MAPVSKCMSREPVRRSRGYLNLWKAAFMFWGKRDRVEGAAAWDPEEGARVVQASPWRLQAMRTVARPAGAKAWTIASKAGSFWKSLSHNSRCWTSRVPSKFACGQGREAD